MAKVNRKINRKLENLNTALINVIIFLLGLIVTGISLFLEENLHTILLSVGCSMLASSIVSFLTSKYIVKQDKVKDIIDNWGLESIYRTRQEMNRSCDEYMEDLKDELDIIAFGLRSFRDSKGALIEEKVKKGLKIRILTIDPDSEFLRQREKDEGKVEGAIKKSIYDLKNWVEQLRKIAGKSENIQIKFYKTLPLDFYFREDNQAYIGPYLHGIDSQQTISFEFKSNSQGFEYYKNYFEKLWNNQELY